MNRRLFLAARLFMESERCSHILAICGQIIAYVGTIAAVAISAITAMSVISSLTADAIMRQSKLGPQALHLDSNDLALLHVILLFAAAYAVGAKGVKVRREVLELILKAFPDTRREHVHLRIWNWILTIVGLVALVFLWNVLDSVNAIVVDAELWLRRT